MMSVPDYLKHPWLPADKDLRVVINDGQPLFCLRCREVFNPDDLVYHDLESPLGIGHACGAGKDEILDYQGYLLALEWSKRIKIRRVKNE